MKPVSSWVMLPALHDQRKEDPRMMDDFGMGRRNAVGGFICGFLVAGLSAVLINSCIVDREKAREERGWTLQHIVTASRDIDEGGELRMELMQQQAIPEQFATESVVRPESINEVVGRTLRVDVRAGDPIMRSFLEPETDVEQSADQGAEEGEEGLIDDSPQDEDAR